MFYLLIMHGASYTFLQFLVNKDSLNIFIFNHCVHIRHQKIKAAYCLNPFLFVTFLTSWVSRLCLLQRCIFNNNSATSRVCIKRVISSRNSNCFDYSFNLSSPVLFSRSFHFPPVNMWRSVSSHLQCFFCSIDLYWYFCYHRLVCIMFSYDS